jgi:uncharacterized protein (DUF1778 family)
MASSPSKTRRIEIRITEHEHSLDLAAAAVSGETLSDFVRRAARHEAERTRYILDDEAAQRFLTALEHPSPTSERGLRRLTEKPSVLPTRDAAAQRDRPVRGLVAALPWV